MVDNFFARVVCGSIVRVIGGEKLYQSYKEGVFRNSGEIHRHMYDRYSLARILKNTGFKNVKKKKCTDSAIVNFNEYQLDATSHGARKPDSLFMEGMKP